VIYDNNPHLPGLWSDWGFACLVETAHDTVLFDTGKDGAILLHNLVELGFDPAQINTVVLSHIHEDHVGGLHALLDHGIEPIVVVPAGFPASFKGSVRQRVRLVELTEPAEIREGIFVTGAMGATIVEQALAIESDAGTIVITGCAHPGVVEMTARAKAVTGQEIALVIGGFHLDSASREEIARIASALRDLGVQRIAPGHCTGVLARDLLAQHFDGDCILIGAGYSLRVPDTETTIDSRKSGTDQTASRRLAIGSRLEDCEQAEIALAAPGSERLFHVQPAHRRQLR
jgi:7,8-dihydropterin-6-yl-methyl-4-(beta-D-ribofuranosyl)aminobenzene 5'-phosphate synthase